MTLVDEKYCNSSEPHRPHIVGDHKCPGMYTYRELIELYLISDSIGWKAPHTYMDWKEEVKRTTEATRHAEARQEAIQRELARQAEEWL